MLQFVISATGKSICHNKPVVYTLVLWHCFHQGLKKPVDFWGESF